MTLQTTPGASPNPTSEPIRTCVGCRTTAAQRRLLRFTRQDDGQVVPATVTRDVRGRSAYVCAQRSCLDQAAKRRAFTRAFCAGRKSVSVVDVDVAALWLATLDQVRREIELLDRTGVRSLSAPRGAENPHAHPRRRGLEQILSELSSQPQTPERSASKRGRETHRTSRGGAPSHG